MPSEKPVKAGSQYREWDFSFNIAIADHYLGMADHCDSDLVNKLYEMTSQSNHNGENRPFISKGAIIQYKDGTRVKLFLTQTSNLNNAYNLYRSKDAVIFIYDKSNLDSKERAVGEAEKANINDAIPQYQCTSTSEELLPLLEQVATQLQSNKKLKLAEDILEESSDSMYASLKNSFEDQVKRIEDENRGSLKFWKKGTIKEQAAPIQQIREKIIQAEEALPMKTSREKLTILIGALKGQIHSLEAEPEKKHEKYHSDFFHKPTSSTSSNLVEAYRKILQSLPIETQAWVDNVRADKSPAKSENPSPGV